MSIRNDTLKAIYEAMGGTESTEGLSRNALLEKITVIDGSFIYISTNEWLLRGWYSAITGTPTKQRSRNEHLRLIAEHKSSTSIPVGMSRNDLLEIILENSAPPFDPKQWPTGTIDFSLNIDFTKQWNFEA